MEVGAMDSLKFGTSGLRGLVTDLDTPAAYAWTRAFLAHLESSRQGGSRTVFIGEDLRASSPAIARRVASAIQDAGMTPVACGALPTPALAMAAMARGGAAVMITGSHIPDDRNGLKFYVPTGEVSKSDEAGIRAAHEALPADVRQSEAALDLSSIEQAGPAALEAYGERYTDFFGGTALNGLIVGLYEQSSVARDSLGDILRGLGADVVSLARADRFIPVDTEAHRPEDIALVQGWAGEGRFDAIVSTDGDADRPMVADAKGAILRGDVLGLIVARHLGLQTIVTPVTSSSAIEATGIATTVKRTKVGSPFVIAGIEEARTAGLGGIVGFEANGGVLLGSDVERDGKRLPALATRDAVLPILCALLETKASGASGLSGVVASLDAGSTAANRLKEVSADRSGPFLKRLAEDEAYRSQLMAAIAPIQSVDDLDGVRMVLAGGQSIHYRASGNAPELRCYVEAPNEDVANTLLEKGLAIAETELAAV